MEQNSPFGHRCGIATERRAFHDFNSSFLLIDSGWEAVKRAAMRNVEVLSQRIEDCAIFLKDKY